MADDKKISPLGSDKKLSEAFGRGSTKRESPWDTDKNADSPMKRETVDPVLQGTDSGSRIMNDLATKKNVREAKRLFEASGQARSPSKDFVGLLVTEKGIIWRKWKITLRGYTSGAAPVPQPQEEVMSMTDFRCNDSLLDEIKMTFGENTLHQIEDIISGSNDLLSCTPESVMIHICSMLDLQSISQLSQVNRHLRKMCTSDKLWSSLYEQHQGTPSSEICELAKSMGWKRVFYSNKLQLQKELSRKRKTNMSQHSTIGKESGGTFLTDNP